ncbi:phosphohistidine phosphatase SixA [Methanoregula sp.]|uniref:phosphohistidine phosphatase SixA n=1 Tax=Methanoregula sp. TaxID=2052170 RepID=UPI0026239A28|nr:phosphohistidine phosphatase SixA [Methanoregula sp.]MDD5142914.1 phosphohistidine phosphatase SixA [Methanoregula sp.]
MDIYILRHGKAEESTPEGGDAARRLTTKGSEEILSVGLFLAAQDLEFDLIAASPLARAQETAAIIAGVLKYKKKPASWNVLVPGGEPDAVCHEISRHGKPSAILLVGHEPLLSSLISRIIAGNEEAGIAMTKGGLAKIRDVSFTQRPSGELHWLLTAKQMTPRK